MTQRLGIIEDGVCINVAAVEDTWTSGHPVGPGQTGVLSDLAEKNWLWDGITFTDPTPPPAPLPPSRPPEWELDTEHKANSLALRGKTKTPAQIEAFIRGKIDADGVSTIADVKLCLKRIETAVVILAKLRASPY